jgi:transcriptional regulator with XRE-family HTH domain
MIEPAQIRAARALLGWRQEDLSMESRVGIATIRRIENTDKDARGHVSTYARIQTALEAAGVLFIDDDGTAGIGVRLIKTKKKKRT